MYPILFYLGNWPIRSYGLLMVMGIIAGLWLATTLARRWCSDLIEHVGNMIIYAVPLGLLGARIWEVVFSWEYYSQHPASIPAIWEGGLSVQGSVIGGLLAVLWYCRKYGIEFYRLGDVLVPGLLLGQAIGRIGCLLNGCCYGVPWPWGIVYSPGSDAYYVFGATPLFPAVVLEALWDVFLMFFFIWYYPRRPFSGAITLGYFILYSLGRFMLEFYRADSLMWMGFKVAQVTTLLTAVIAAWLLYRRWHESKVPKTR